MLIKKNSIAENQPNEDFYITSGHYLILNNQLIKAGKIPQARQVKIAIPEITYSICTESGDPIIVNGLNVMTWNYDKWLKKIIHDKKKLIFN